MTAHAESGASPARFSLRPTLVGVALFVCLLLPFVALTSGTRGRYVPAQLGEPATSTTWRRIGPGLVTVTTSDVTGVPVTTVDVGWLALAATLGLGYVVSRLITHRVTGRIGMRASRRLLVGVPLVLTVLTVVAAAGVSRWYWGYWFSRPGVQAIAAQIARPTHVSFVWTGEYRIDAAIDRPLERLPDRTVDDSLGALAEDPYYGLDGRVLAALERNGAVVRGLPPVPDDDLRRLRAALRPAGVPLDTTARYESTAGWLRGIVIRGAGPGGDPRLVTVLKGGEVSNDHRVCYELALSWPETGDAEVLERQHFFYDLAGLEGMEWPSIARVLGALWMAVLSAVLVVIACLPSRRRQR